MSNFDLTTSVALLEKTPQVLRDLLQGLPDEWIHANEGGDTWSAFDIIGHLIHGEQTDWIPRMNIILGASEDKTFPPFDRWAQIEISKGKNLTMLLDEFEACRKESLAALLSRPLTENDLSKTGFHPAFGEVTLKALLSCWTVHDLNHLSQISRVMAKRYSDDVGPWIQYLRILQS